MSKDHKITNSPRLFLRVSFLLFPPLPLLVPYDEKCCKASSPLIFPSLHLYPLETYWHMSASVSLSCVSKKFCQKIWRNAVLGLPTPLQVSGIQKKQCALNCPGRKGQEAHADVIRDLENANWFALVIELPGIQFKLFDSYISTNYHSTASTANSRSTS